MTEHPAPRLGEIGQIAFTVSDVDRAVEFFRDRVGLTLLFRAPPALAFFACGSVRLMLSKREGTAAVAGNSTLYFKVADIHAAHAELKGRGIVFEDEPHLIVKMPDHELWMVFFRDPDGSLLGLMHEKR